MRHFILLLAGALALAPFAASHAEQSATPATAGTSQTPTAADIDILTTEVATRTAHRVASADATMPTPRPPVR